MEKENRDINEKNGENELKIVIGKIPCSICWNDVDSCWVLLCQHRYCDDCFADFKKSFGEYKDSRKCCAEGWNYECDKLYLPKGKYFANSLEEHEIDEIKASFADLNKYFHISVRIHILMHNLKNNWLII